MQATETRDRAARDWWTLAREAENRGDRGATVAALGQCFVQADDGSGLEKVALSAWYRVRAGGRI